MAENTYMLEPPLKALEKTSPAMANIRVKCYSNLKEITMRTSVRITKPIGAMLQDSMLENERSARSDPYGVQLSACITSLKVGHSEIA